MRRSTTCIGFTLLALLMSLVLIGKNSRAEEKGEGDRKTALTAQLVLKVIQPREVTAALIAKAKELGGFPIRITNDVLVIKVPGEKLEEMVTCAAEKGWLLEKQIGRDDLQRTVMDLEGRIRSKQEVLGTLRAFFESADATATIDIERKMTQLVSTIESLKGQLRVALERARYGVLTVDYRYQKRDNIVYKRSPFPWINDVNLDDFLTEF